MRIVSVSRPEGSAAAVLVDSGSSTRVVPVLDERSGEAVTVKELLEDWATWSPRLRELEAQGAVDEDLELAQVELLAPVPEPRSLTCVGLNYRDHATETGASIPREPILFAKQPTSVTHPNSVIWLPPASSEVDFEAELAVVIGVGGRNIPPERALQHVAGYTAFNDVSARDWQARSSQWMAAKSFDTFGPMGPVLVTTDEIPDPQQLRVDLRLNGLALQESSTKEMIFSVAELIAYISAVWPLSAGDVIATGTPAGVGFTRTPPVFMKNGDIVEVEIEKIGVLSNTVRSEEGPS